MEGAVELLLTTDDKTYVIAEKTGYTDPNYFSYVFKKQYGMSPSKIRQVEKLKGRIGCKRMRERKMVAEKVTVPSWKIRRPQSIQMTIAFSFTVVSVCCLGFLGICFTSSFPIKWKT